MKPILNSKGQPIVLNAQEERISNYLESQIKNATGYEVSITTLTTIIKKVSEQKFFQVMPADYMPVLVGEGAWSSNLTTYRSFLLGDDFETGNLNTGAGNTKLASADAAVDTLNRPVINWAKGLSWSLPDLMLAAKSGNWDLVSSKEKSRKTNWDLGVQAIAFLGSRSGVSGIKGLLNQSGVTNDTTTLTQPISSLSTVDLKAFCSVVVEKYRANCNRTAMPTHFVIPESDYNGLASTASADFPIKSTLQLLEETFQVITMKKGFKILPLAYADAAFSLGVLSTQRYVLLNYDEDSLRMDIPVDYTSTLANSTDNFMFQNAAYGQYSGVQATRPAELYYFSFSL